MAEQHAYLQARVSRRTLLKGAALVSTGPMLLRSTRADAATPLGPRWLGYGNDPRTSMTLSTSMPGSFRSAVAEYGPDSSFGGRVDLEAAGVAGTPTRYAAARITGLTPGTTYAYRMRVDGRASTTGSFTTAPAQAGPFTFTAFGDEGVSRTASSIVEQISRLQPALHLVAGDLCYADRDGSGAADDAFRIATWDTWLRLIEPVAAAVPWMTAVGNHEMEPGYGAHGYGGYLARFALPSTGASGCPATYHFRYGSVAFVQVDSNEVSWEIPHNLDYSGGAQTTWLESVLAGYRADPGVDFIVVTMHHCAYSTSRAHGSEGGVRTKWSPLFDRYEVDLVISGHNHLYERSQPMRAGAPVAQVASGGEVQSVKGTTYLTVGGGGVGLNTEGFFRDQYKISTPDTVRTGRKQVDAGDFSAVTSSGYCYLVAAVTPAAAGVGAAVRLTVFDSDAKQIDTVTLARAATPVRSSAVANTEAGGGDDTGLYVGVGAGAVALAAAGGAGYVAMRRRAER